MFFFLNHIPGEGKNFVRCWELLHPLLSRKNSEHHEATCRHQCRTERSPFPRRQDGAFFTSVHTGIQFEQSLQTLRKHLLHEVHFNQQIPST